MRRATKPHIALYIATLGGGGAERVLVHLANGFVRRGYRTDLLLTRAEGPYVSALDENVCVIDFGHDNQWKDVRGLARYLRRERPDCLLTAITTANIIGVTASMLARNGKTRVVVSEHAHPSMMKRATTARSRHLLPMLVSWLYPKSFAVIAVSDGVRNALLARHRWRPDHVQTIYNPVITEALPALVNEPVTHPWFHDASVPVLLAVGRLIKVKDFSTLIKAAAIVNQSRPARLVLIGEGTERDNLVREAKRLGLDDRFAILDFDNNPYRYMRRASVYVLSSKSEALPTVLIEAMAAGAKIVATDCDSGPREILGGGEHGTLVPVGDYRAMAAAIIRALDAPKPRYDEAVLLPYTVDYALDRYLTVMGIDPGVGRGEQE